MTQCLPGTYSKPTETTCTNCPAGSECPKTDPETSETASWACPAGSFSPLGDSVCYGVRPGYQISGNSGETACTSGQYSSGGTNICRACGTATDGTAQPNHYCPNPSMTPIPCAPGKIYFLLFYLKPQMLTNIKWNFFPKWTEKE